MTQGATVQLLSKGEKLANILGKGAAPADAAWLDCWRDAVAHSAAAAAPGTSSHSSSNANNRSSTASTTTTAITGAASGHQQRRASTPPPVISELHQWSSDAPPPAPVPPLHSSSNSSNNSNNNSNNSSSAAAPTTSAGQPLCYACRNPASAASHVKHVSNSRSVSMVDLNWWLVPACASHYKRSAAHGSPANTVVNESWAVLVSPAIQARVRNHAGPAAVDKVKGWLRGKPQLHHS